MHCILPHFSVVSDMIMNGFNEIIVASFAGDHYFFVTIFLVFIGEVLGGALRILMRTILSEGPMNALVYGMHSMCISCEPCM